MILLGFFVSAARKIALSQPKKVSAMKKIANTIAIVGKTKNGFKLAGSKLINPGMIIAVTAVNVINAKVTKTKVDVCIPLKAT